MTADELDVIVSGIAPVMREYVASKLEGLQERNAVLEQRLIVLEQRGVLPGPAGESGAPGPIGPAGRDGTSVEISDVFPLVVEEVSKAITALPPAKDGRDGTDGKDGASVALDDVRPLISAEVTKAVADLPPAKDGEPGQSVDPADVDVLIGARVEKAMAALPTPQDGKDGTHGTDGKSLMPDDVAPLIVSEVSKAVSALPVPKDPIGVVSALIDRAGHLVLTLSDGSTKDVGPVVGRDVEMADVARVITEELASWPRPKDGLNGNDGVGFEDMDSVLDEYGRMSLRFVRGGNEKAFRVPGFVDRGVYKPDTLYVKGDGVTWAGSYWIAQDETQAKPGDGATPWRLAVKAGRDGKLGPQGQKGLDGVDGRPGRDGRQF